MTGQGELCWWPPFNPHNQHSHYNHYYMLRLHLCSLRPLHDVPMWTLLYRAILGELPGMRDNMLTSMRTSLTGQMELLLKALRQSSSAVLQQHRQLGKEWRGPLSPGPRRDPGG